MKSIEKSVYIVIIIVLVAIIASGTTYIIMKDKDDVKVNDNENNKHEQDVDKVENKKKENITLSDEELEEYLEYIPFSLTSEINEEVDAYSQSKTYATEISNAKLLETALTYLRERKESCAGLITTYEGANKQMLKMYNQAMGDYSINDNSQKWYSELFDNENFYDIGLSNYISDGHVFAVDVCEGFYDGYRQVDEYEFINDNLVIYGYFALPVEEYTNEWHYYLEDQFTKRMYETNSSDYLSYLKEHKTEFTKYKHTFKKNSTGYYWYSTEVVS